jgi:FtsJ-like methyltransferase
MEYINKIYKSSNLEYNDSISNYNGWGAQQNPNTFEVFHYFLQDAKPKRILEIGASVAGLTQFLYHTANDLQLDCKLISFDVVELPYYKNIRETGVDIRIENIFNKSYSTVKQEIIDFINEDGVTVILCDGGNKVGEFNILSKYMKSGDYILAHDYCENKQVFIEKVYKKIWNWHEISDEDIKNACELYNLESYNKEIFDNVVWVCKKKK